MTWVPIPSDGEAPCSSVRRLRISAQSFAMIGFMLLYPLDIVTLAVESATGLWLPSGSLGIAIGLVLLPWLMRGRGRVLAWRLGSTLLLLTPILLAASSGRFEWSDVYHWARAAALFSLGYFFIKWLGEHPRGAPAIKLAMLACGALCLFMPRQLAEAAGGNYLRVADAMMLIAFATLATCRSLGLYWTVAGISVLCLLFVDSRFSIVATCIAVASLGLLRNRPPARMALVLLSIPIMSVGGLLVYMYFLAINNIHEHRLLRLFLSPDLDTSLAVRLTLNAQAWSVFEENPILGDYHYYTAPVAQGGYAHNFLSLWAELGIVGVAISAVMIGTALRTMGRYRLRLSEANIGFAFLTAVALVLGMLFAKSFHWTVMYFAFGVLLGVSAGDIRFRERVAV